jgi:Tfp pilus assembly protein PilV
MSARTNLRRREAGASCASRRRHEAGASCASRRRHEAGVTLVELLIATFLLALILLAIAPLFISSVKSNYSANEYTSIHNIARDRLEQLMSLPFNDVQLAPTAGTTNDLPPNLPDPTTGIPSATSPVNTLSVTYSVQLYQETAPATGQKWIFNPVAAGAGWDFKRIDVTVTSSSFNTPSGLGIGSRTARVTGFIRNPSPGLP